MKKLIEAINKKLPSKEVTIDEWNETAKVLFGPYFRRKSILWKNRDIFRSELVNLAKIYPHREYTDLLKYLLRMYRSVIRTDRNGSYRFLTLLFQDNVAADEKWMSFFISYVPPSETISNADRVYQNFDVLDAILEGSYKLHIRLLYGFSCRYSGASFPSNVRSLDFGATISNFPAVVSSRIKLLLEDNEHKIKVNQWRNIAAHKSFAMKTSKTFEVEYGKANPRVKRMTLASLVRTVKWATLILTTVRLCNVIVYIEHMRELQSFGLPTIPVRLESWLTGLCHDFGTVGFRCVTYRDEGDRFVLTFRDDIGRPIREAIIHASQALNKLSIGLSSSLSHRVRTKRASVQLVDEKGTVLAIATVDVKAALAYSDKAISMKKYIDQIDFKVM